MDKDTSLDKDTYLDKDTLDFDIPPLSKQILNLLLEAKEIRVILGIWTFFQILVFGLLVYIAIIKR